MNEWDQEHQAASIEPKEFLGQWECCKGWFVPGVGPTSACGSGCRGGGFTRGWGEDWALRLVGAALTGTHTHTHTVECTQ